MAAEVTDQLWERKVARHYYQVDGLTEFRQGSLVLCALEESDTEFDPKRSLT